MTIWKMLGNLKVFCDFDALYERYKEERWCKYYVTFSVGQQAAVICLMFVSPKPISSKPLCLGDVIE
jgi:hypothetical protein